RLHAAAGAVDQVLGLWVPVAPGATQHQRQMPAGRGPADADTVGVDLEIVGVRADVADGAGHVGHAPGNGVFRLAAVYHREHRVAALDKLRGEGRLDVVVVRNPAPADANHHRRAVALAVGHEGVHR